MHEVVLLSHHDGPRSTSHIPTDRRNSRGRRLSALRSLRPPSGLSSSLGTRSVFALLPWYRGDEPAGAG